MGPFMIQTPSDIFKLPLIPKLEACLTLTNEQQKNKRTQTTYQAYPPSQLHILIASMKKTKKNKTLRFVIDQDKKTWFAEEGKSQNTTSHRILGNDQSCLAAGDIKLTKDYESIKWINNKSGAYEPPFVSLIWILASLCINKEILSTAFRLPSILVLKEVYPSGADACTHEMDTSTLSAWINSLLTPIQQDSIKCAEHEAIKPITITVPPQPDFTPKRLLANALDFTAMSPDIITSYQGSESGSKKSRLSYSFFTERQAAAASSSTNSPVATDFSPLFPTMPSRSS